MSTTTNTLPHDTYANQTTPLWATAGAGQQFVSPSEVTNDVIPPTAEITTIVNADVTGSFQLNTIPNGTPLNEIKLEGLTNGISLYTNGQPTFTSAPGATSVLGDLNITSQQTGGTWTFNNNELSYNNVKQLTGDTTYTQLGENTYSDQYGLNVWNVNSSNKTSTISDREIYFTTTTNGATTTNTYDFISPLVPNRTTANPLIRNPNSRTPLYPNPAFFPPQNTSSSISVSLSAPYSVSVTNINPAVFNVGVFLAQSSAPNDWIPTTELPLWFEVELFDPGSQVYRLRNNAGGFGQTDLLDNIQNVAGTLSFVPLGSSTPVTYVLGDVITIVYEWIDIPTGQAQVLIAKNNVVVSTAPVGITLASFLVINFTSLTQVPSGFTFTLPSFNWGNTNPIISSFNGWEWSAGLGGLYPRNNTALAPASSGSNPPAILYDSVFLLGGCSMTSPPISSGQGLTITIAGFKGSKLGTGTLQIFQNTFSQIFSGVITNAWTSGTIATAVSTGSDTFTFVYTSATDVLSLQRITISYITPVDVLDGGVGMNGTNLNLGVGNYYSAPTMSMTSSNVVLTKPINMSNFNINNVGTISTNTLTSSSGGEINVTGSLNMYNNSFGNVFEINVSNSRANNIRAPYGLSNINVLNNLNLSNNIISNVNQLNGTQVNASSVVSAPNIEGVAGSLNIGFSSADVDIFNLQFLTGRGSNFPGNMTLIDNINQLPAIHTGIIFIQVNFDGFKEVAIPLIPTKRVTDTVCYRLSSPNYLSTTGYTISGKSILTIYDSTGINILEQFANSSEGPVYFAGTAMILNTTTINYTYQTYLPSL
jgi:hypothetical protein